MNFILTVLLSWAYAENLHVGCATAHGALSHNLTRTETGYAAHVQFPRHRNSEGKRVLNVPLTNDNSFSDNLDFLKEKRDFFSAVFGDKDYITLKFEEDRCGSVEHEGHVLWICAGEQVLEVEGLDIENVEFSLESQKRINLVGEVQIYYADLIIKTKPNEVGISRVYRSSYTYYTNDSGTACYINMKEKKG